MGDGESKSWAGWLRRLKAVSLCAVSVALLVGMFWARHWPLVHDAPLMHYVVFLMQHGMTPYLDIVDQQMPGSYFVDGMVMHTLGSGALAWVCFDFLTGAVCVLASVWIAGGDRRWAGAMAGGFAYLYHLSGGPANLGERDWTVAVLLLVAMGSLFRRIRGGRAGWIGVAMFCIAFASTIKPQAVLMAGVVVFCLFWQRRLQGLGASVAWGVFGGAIPLAALCGFLSFWHIWGVFFGPLREFLVYYAAQQKAGVRHMLWVAVTPWLIVMAVGAAALFVRGRRWKSWESDVLLAASAVGFLLYFVQRKGWPYHGYSLAVFLLLWVFVELDAAMSHESGRSFAAVLVALAVVFVPPRLLQVQHDNPYYTTTIDHLQADLTSLGVQKEQGSVQCLDVTQGCLDVLLRMKRVQATGYMYDFYLFPEKDAGITRALQARFLQKMETAPPRLIVLSAQVWPGDYSGYYEVARWPAFEQFLSSRYTLGPEMASGIGPGTMGYRIYLRK